MNAAALSRCVRVWLIMAVLLAGCASPSDDLGMEAGPEGEAPDTIILEGSVDPIFRVEQAAWYAWNATAPEGLDAWFYPDERFGNWGVFVFSVDDGEHHFVGGRWTGGVDVLWPGSDIEPNAPTAPQKVLDIELDGTLRLDHVTQYAPHVWPIGDLHVLVISEAPGHVVIRESIGYRTFGEPEPERPAVVAEVDAIQTNASFSAASVDVSFGALHYEANKDTAWHPGVEVAPAVMGFEGAAEGRHQIALVHAWNMDGFTHLAGTANEHALDVKHIGGRGLSAWDESMLWQVTAEGGLAVHLDLAYASAWFAGASVALLEMEQVPEGFQAQALLHRAQPPLV